MSADANQKAELEQMERDPLLFRRQEGLYRRNQVVITVVTDHSAEGAVDTGGTRSDRWTDRCRMCYDGEWTDRMTPTLVVFDWAVREHNQSVKHRLPTKLSPIERGDSPAVSEVLWHRHDTKNTAKFVEVTRRLEDVDSGRRE